MTRHEIKERRAREEVLESLAVALAACKRENALLPTKGGSLTRSKLAFQMELISALQALDTAIEIAESINNLPDPHPKRMD